MFTAGVPINPATQREPVEASTCSHYLPGYAGPNVLCSTYCDKCFTEVGLSVCRQTYDNCSTLYTAYPIKDCLVLKTKSTLIFFIEKYISQIEVSFFVIVFKHFGIAVLKVLLRNAQFLTGKWFFLLGLL